MNFKCRYLLLLLGLMSLATGAETSLAANIFVQDPAYFHQRQDYLKKLQQELDSPNESLDSLLVEADRIAQMSDKCTVVSINDVMDETCWTFYKVELPAFEQHYAEITGEVRLGYIETVRNLEDRKLQIDACANSLVSFVFSKEENLNVEGGVALEPRTNGIEANYDFTIQYQQDPREDVMKIAKVWGETCKDMVIRQDGAGFAPFLLEQLDRLNKELKDRGSLAVLKVDTAAAPTIYVDIAKPVRSAYYLNDTKIFHSRISSSSVDNSHLRITFTKDGVIAGGEKIVNKPNGVPMQYKGSVQFPANTTKIDGRWFMEGNGNTVGVDFGPDYDEDSLAVAKAEEAKQEQIAAQNIAAEKAKEEANRKGLHFSFWAGLTNDIVAYTDESVCDPMFMNRKTKEVNKFDNDGLSCYNVANSDNNLASPKYYFYMPDIAAAARIRYNFGQDGNFFATAGVGAMFGLAVAETVKTDVVTKGSNDKNVKRVYGGLLAQLEAGYKDFGIRETIIFPINIDEGPYWTQFRTGGFYDFGLLNIELGYTIIMNAGSGFYAGLGKTF